MCNALDYAMGHVLGQRVDKKIADIHYVIKTLDQAQMHNKMTEKELLAVVYALEKLWPQILGSKIIIYTNHLVLKYLLSKKESKSRMIQWVLFLQEFDLETKDKKGSENSMADQLSCLHITSMGDTSDTFSNEYLLPIRTKAPWFTDIVNFLVIGSISKKWSRHQKNKFFHELKYYF